MKKTISLLVIALFSTTALFAQKGQVEKNIKMYETVWDDVINKAQIDQINSDNFDENIVMVYSPDNVVGIDAFKAYYQNFITGFSDINFTIIEIFGEGDNLVKQWNFKGKHTGDFFGIPATGNMVNMEGVTLVKMKNGKIAQEQDFMDNAVMMQQLGLVSDPNNLTVIDKLYKAFAVGDVPTVLGGMDPKIEWNEAEGNAYAKGNPYIGPDAVLNGIFAPIMAEHEHFKLTDIQLHEMSNNQVLATLRYDAKVKANGAPYNTQVAHVWTLKNGKITAFQQYLDTKKVADAFGK